LAKRLYKVLKNQPRIYFGNGLNHHHIPVSENKKTARKATLLSTPLLFPEDHKTYALTASPAPFPQTPPTLTAPWSPSPCLRTLTLPASCSFSPTMSRNGMRLSPVVAGIRKKTISGINV
jgi:hypothetical protein